MSGGSPLFADSQPIVLSYILLLYFIFPKIGTIIYATAIFNVLLAGIFMYILAINLKVKPKFALISSIIYMFSDWLIIMTITGHLERSIVYAWTPLGFLFILLAFKRKNWIKYSILSAIVFAIQFHGSGHLTFMFLLPFYLLFFTFKIFGKNFKKKLIKSILIAIVIGLFFGGLIAIRIMPLMEFSEESSKQFGYPSYEQSVGTKIEIKKITDLFTFPTKLRAEAGMGISIAAILLTLLSLLGWKNKKISFLWLSIILIFLIATGSGVYYIFWKYIPGFDKIHHVARSSYLLIFTFSILAGFGSQILLSKLKKIKIKNIIYTLILILIIGQSVVFERANYAKLEIALGNESIFKEIRPATHFQDPNMEVIRWGPESFEAHFNRNQLMKYVSKDKDIFRIHNIGTVMLGGSACAYATEFDLQILTTCSSIWVPEFFNEYLGMSHRQPAKFYGNINTKYIYSKNPVNITGLKFLKEFDDCFTGKYPLNCHEDPGSDNGISGPYLYLNEMFLPRAYIAENSILIVGEKDPSKQMMYGLMLNGKFNPSNTVIAMGNKEKINDYTIDFLNKFDAVFLIAGSIDQDSGLILNQYVNNNGILFPDLTKGENSFSSEKIENLLSSFKGNYSNVNKAEITYNSPNKKTIDVTSKEGFLVLAEKYILFNTWEAKADNQEKELLRANGVNTAIYVSNNKEAIFRYSSETFNKGLIISLVTLFIILLYFSYSFYKRKIRNIQKKT
jgi:hypothetical protein